ncbi:class C sortase [Microbacterium album]|uniref:class C sortase n=1 Tax=Microbacterium album TaxID=2053191 RepID=UPI001E50F0CC|nr:class C sortase [Microbacterium album]
MGVIIFAGVCVLTYPTAGNWFTDLAHGSEVSGYVSHVEGTPTDELADQLDDARAYNANLPAGPLRDPYILNASGEAVSLEEDRADYLGQLALAPGSPMARIRIPSIRADLPIFHGTDDDVLRKGVGHLHGSALPVGGEGTHSVLTGHSGLPEATLFTRLHELTEGDLFYIDVAGERLAYRVDRIVTVEPNDGEELRQTAGRDYVTLLTCTPIGVNSHRLLVRGERIDDDSAEAAISSLPSEPASPGFPWWTLALAGGAAVSGTIAWPRRPKPAPAAA